MASEIVDLYPENQGDYIAKFDIKNSLGDNYNVDEWIWKAESWYRDVPTEYTVQTNQVDGEVQFKIPSLSSSNSRNAQYSLTYSAKTTNLEYPSVRVLVKGTIYYKGITHG